MRYTLALLALAAGVLANPRPQGVTEQISPSAVPPSSCVDTRSGSFQITVQNVTKSGPAKRDLAERQDDGKLTITLTDGLLKDQLGRTGYIAANYQFQFDKPPQTGAIFTSGWSLCSNGSLALGGSAIFYQCLSGNFFNLYDRHWAAQCNAIYIEAIGGSTGPVPPSTTVPSTTPTASSTIPPSTVAPTTSSTAVVATPKTPTSTPTPASNATASSTGAAGGEGSSSVTASASASSSGTGVGSSGSEAGAGSTTVVVTTSPSSAVSAPTSGSGGAATATSGAPAGTSSAPAVSTGGAVPCAVSAPQGLLALVAGVFGAVILI